MHGPVNVKHVRGMLS